MRFRDRRATALSSIMAAQTASSMTVPRACVIPCISCRGVTVLSCRLEVKSEYVSESRAMEGKFGGCGAAAPRNFF